MRFRCALLQKKGSGIEAIKDEISFGIMDPQTGALWQRPICLR